MYSLLRSSFLFVPKEALAELGITAVVGVGMTPGAAIEVTLEELAEEAVITTLATLS